MKKRMLALILVLVMISSMPAMALAGELPENENAIFLDEQYVETVPQPFIPQYVPQYAEELPENENAVFFEGQYVGIVPASTSPYSLVELALYTIGSGSFSLYELPTTNNALRIQSDPTVGTPMPIAVVARPGFSISEFNCLANFWGPGQPRYYVICNTNGYEASRPDVRDEYKVYYYLVPSPPFFVGPAIQVFFVGMWIEIDDDVYNATLVDYDWEDYIKSLALTNMRADSFPDLAFEPVILSFDCNNFRFILGDGTQVSSTLRIDKIIGDSFLDANGNSIDIRVAPVGNLDVGTYLATILAHTERLANPAPCFLVDINAGRLCPNGEPVLVGTFSDVYEFKVDLLELSVVKESDHEYAIAGRTLTYRIVVENTGTLDLTNVVIIDTLPSNTEFVSTSHGAHSGGTVTYTIATLVPGEEVEITIVVRVLDSAQVGDEVTNKVIVTSYELEEPEEDDHTLIVEEYALLVIKDSEYLYALADEEITYTIVVKNTGTVDLTDVEIVDQLPHNTIFVSALPGTHSGGALTNGVIVNGVLTNGVLIGGYVTYIIDTLEPDEEVTITIVVRVLYSANAGDSVTNNVSVTSNELEEPEEDSHTLPVEEYALLVIKDSDYEYALADEKITYTIFVKNMGTLNLTNVVITDTLPENSVFYSTLPGTYYDGVVTYVIDILEPEEKVIITITVTICPNAKVGDTVVNKVIVTSNELEDPEEDTHTLIVQEHALLVEKDSEYEYALAGEEITYTIVVKNTGTVDLTDVEIIDTLPSNTEFVSTTHGAHSGGVVIDGVLTGGYVTYTIDILEPEEEVKITIVVKVLDSAEAGDSVTNKVIVTSNELEDPEYDTHTLPVKEHALLVEKDSEYEYALVGEEITYTILVKNIGTLDLTDVEIIDTLPSNTEFVSTSHGAHSGGTVTYTIATLVPGEEVEITIVVRVLDSAQVGDEVTNKVIVTSNELEDPEEDYHTLIVEEYALLVTKKSVETHAIAGGTITYTILVENIGTLDLTNVEIIDTLPNNVEFYSTTHGTHSGVNPGGVVAYTRAVLPVGGEVIITIVVTVLDSAQDGDTVVNAVVVTSNELDEPEEDDHTLYVRDYALRVTKISEEDYVHAGGTITYTILVENMGRFALTDVLVTDTLPTNAVFVSTTHGTYSAGVVTYAIATLPVYGEVTITIVVTAAADAQAGDTVVNTVVVTSYELDEPEEDEDSIYVEDSYALEVRKTSAQTNALAGGNITYTVVVENIGSADLTNVVITDTLPTNTTFVSTTHGTHYAGIVTHTIDTFPSGATVTITIVVRVATNAQVGDTVVNIVVVTSPDLDAPEYDDDTLTVVPPPPPGGGPGPGISTPPTQPPTPEEEIEDDRIPLVPFTPTHYRYLIGDHLGLIRPRDSITRAEVATIFFRLITDDFRDQMWTQTNRFPDVVLQNWFNNGISTMTNANLLRGMPDGSFQPNRAITRAEFAAIVSRFVDLSYDGDDLFPDIIGHWAQDYVNLVGSLGWVIGVGNGDFEPNRNITRAEAATIVNRILIRHPETVDDLLDDMRRWPDNVNETVWYFIDIQEATNSNAHEMKDCGFYKTWIEIIPCPDWAALERPNSTSRAHRGTTN